MKITGPLVLLASALAFLPVVQAGPSHAEWRYCLAVSQDRSEVIMSTPMLTESPLPQLEQGFDRFLTAQGISHEASACPRAESPRGIEELRDFAARYNRNLGLQPRFVEWSEL
jgi:hypothetical protein